MIAIRSERNNRGWPLAPSNKVLIAIAVCTLLFSSLLPVWGWAGRVEGVGQNNLISQGPAPKGNLLARLWQGGSAFIWQELLRTAMPKPLWEAAPNSGGLGRSLAVWLAEQGITTPRAFLAWGVPMLRGISTLEDEMVLPPANEPIVPALVLPEPDTEAASAFGWKYTPHVLIYHTHNVESFTPTTGKTHVYDDPEQTIVRIGAKLAEDLRALGIQVTHSRADNVKNNYTAAYNESLKTVMAALQAEPTIEYSFDVHRDAVPRSATTTVIEGQSVGRLYFLVGSNEGLNHPNWRKNMAFAEKLHAKSEELYPGLSRGILNRQTARFNQHVRENAVLVEIGGDKNTMDEALRTAGLLANIIAEVIRDQQQGR
ncbi:MAG TPA: stage II sporulation protein P [Firmicutes bacterium]|nr:stage II sporulation protein P [Bacillota bacterium]